MKQSVKIRLVVLICLAILFGFYTYKNIEKNAGNLYKITIEDPLLYGEMPIEELGNAINLLVKKEKEFLEGFRNYPDGQNAFFDKKHWRLFPIEFLKAFEASSEKTSKFLKNPSPMTAFQMLKTNQTAAWKYKSYIETQLLVVNKLIEENPDSANSNIVFLRVSTNLSIVRADYEIALKNSEKLWDDIRDRRKCFFSGQCDISAPAKQEKTIEISDSKNREKNIDIDLSSAGKNEKPGVFIASTSCFGQNKNLKPKLQAFYMTEKFGKLKPKLASENYYLNYEALRNSWSLAEKFLNKGIAYDLQLETSDYRCPDLTYLIDLYYEYFSGKPLFGLSHIINDIAANLDFLILTQKIEKKPADLLYLLTSRTDYSIFLMPYDMSVWRIAERPKYFNAGIDLPRYFETYSSLKQKGYSDEKIKTFNNSQGETLKELIKN